MARAARRADKCRPGRRSLACEMYHIRPRSLRARPPCKPIPHCGGAAMREDYRNKRAVVIGASMGGLLAARALADYYGEVTVVERDALPDGYEPRKGVPQGRH